MKLQLKRSKSVTGPADAKQPVAPTVEQTLYGELCVNYNAGDPALYVKTENPDSIVRIDGNTKTYNISTQSITDGAQIDLNHKNTGLNNTTVESSVLLKQGTGIEITRESDGNITIKADGSSLTGVNLSYKKAAAEGTVENTAGSNATIPLVDGSYAGLMSPSDKTKLNNIDAGADVNPAAGRALTYNGSTLDADIATASDFGVVKIGSGLDIDDNGILTASGTAAVNLNYEAAENQGTVTNSAGDDAVIPLADGTNAGLFTATEKTKLSGIETGAQKNVAVNLNYEAAANQGTVTNTAGNNAVIPLADGTDAGLTIENFTTELKTKLEGLDDIDVDSTPPSTPNAGDLWIDTGKCPPELKIWDDCSDPGNPSWTPIGGGTPPIPAITFDVSITDSGTDGNVVGETLTAVAANIAGGVDPIVKGYKWFVDNVEDTAATTNTRVIVASDIGLEITCEITCGEPGDPAADVTKTATYGKTPAASAINFTAAITDSGTDGNKVGQTLTAVAQSISGGLSPVEKAYQWYSNGIPEAGPEGAQKEKDILVSDVGETITCEITVAEPDGSNAVTKTATYGRTPVPAGVINKPAVLTPPDGAGVGGDSTYTPKTSAITDLILPADEWVEVPDLNKFTNNTSYVSKSWGNDDVIYVMYENNAWSSVDGLNYTSVSSNMDDYNDIRWHGTEGGFTGTGSRDNELGVSADGRTWTKANIFPIQDVVFGSFRGKIAYGNGIYVTNGYAFTNIVDYSIEYYSCTSPDGINYTKVYSHQGSGFKFNGSIDFGNGRFMTVASSAAVSTDGINWTTLGNTFSPEPSDLKYGNGVWVASTASSGTYYSSNDNGVTWTQGTVTLSNSTAQKRLDFANGVFILYESNDGQSNNGPVVIFTSRNGRDWKKDKNSISYDGTSASYYMGFGAGASIFYTDYYTNKVYLNNSLGGYRATLTLTDSKTYNNAGGADMSTPISEAFVAGDTVKGKVVSPGPDTPAFSTTFYEGVGFGSDAAETVIPTGINNTNKALVWTKNRDKGATPGGNHYLWTTSFDGNLKSNDRDGLGTSPSYAQASYTSNSAILPSDLSGNGWSLAGDNYVAWNFRAAPGFFDIVTYDGTSETTEIPHSLGSTPGVVIVKKTTAASQWSVYHSSLGPTKYIELNAPSPEKTTSYYWNDTSPTSSVFTVDTNSDVNELNHKYVAYLFADTPGKIKCGGYDGIGTDQIIETGFACAWVMIKSTKNSDNWKVFWREAPAEEMLFPNTNDPETPTYSGLRMDEPAVPDQNGFSVDGQDIANKNGETYIYVAIAKDVVAGEIPPTGTLTADADDAGPTISLTNVTGTWEDGMEVVNDKELTEFAPSAADLQFTSSVPSGTDITTYAFATWEVDTDSLFGSPMTTPKAITAGAIQELLPSERGAITLAGDTEYHVRVKYTSSDPAGVQSQYSDANHFKTAYIPQDGWNLVTIPTDRRWQEIAYGDGKYVAVGEDGGQRLMISTDAVSWSERTVPQDMWRVLTYGDGKFVAVALQGGANGVMWSTEPFGGWSLASLPTSIDNISGIVYGGDKFVVVGQTGSTKVVWANDPAGPWTGAILPENNFWMDVTYGSGYYVAIASSGTSRIAWATNPNGPWTANSNVPDAEYRAITYGDGKFVAVAARGSAGVIYAEDPTGTWTTATNGAAFGDAIAYGDNKFLTVSENGPNNISYAEDPAGPWTAVAAPVDQGWHRVMYGGGKFVSLAYEGTDQLMWSETGKAASALFTAYDADNKKSVNDLNIVERYGVDPTADNTHLGIYELTEQPTGAVAAYVPEGDKYKPIIDLSRPLERAQAEAAQANARLDEANATIETIRADFEARISTLESGS